MSDKLKKFLSVYFPTETGELDDIVIRLLCGYKGIDPPKPQFKFDAIVHYNKGLGPESKIFRVIAENPVQAKQLGKEEADKIFGEGKWQEVRVKPIGPA